MGFEPNYLKLARSYIGLKEIPGVKHNATIVRWIESLKAWWRDDETPWCGVFVAHCLQASGITSYPKEYYRAKAWAWAGIDAQVPRMGSVAVLEREGGGHVGFVTGISKDWKRVRLLGGNQGNMVSEAWFDASRVIAYRKFGSDVLDLAPVAKVGEMSKTEA